MVSRLSRIRPLRVVLAHPPRLREASAGGNVAIDEIMRGRLIGDHVGDDAAREQRLEDVGGIAIEADRGRAARLACAASTMRDGCVKIIRALIQKAAGHALLRCDPDRSSTHRIAAPAIRPASGCAPPMPPSPGGQDEAALPGYCRSGARQSA